MELVCAPHENYIPSEHQDRHSDRVGIIFGGSSVDNLDRWILLTWGSVRVLSQGPSKGPAARRLLGLRVSRAGL